MPNSPAKPVYVPYLFLREPLVETPLDESGGFPATKLPYIAFLQRWQSRYSRFWEDGDGSLTAYDFWMLLRSVFVVRSGSAEESALTAVGADIAAELNALEVTHAYTEAKMVADCEDYLEGWPSYGDPERIPLFVCAHNFDAWNWHEHVWRTMRRSPVEFKPLPAADLTLLNNWLFGRYAFSKDADRFQQQLEQAVLSAKRDNSPKKLVAEGLLAGLKNTANLLAFKAC